MKKTVLSVLGLVVLFGCAPSAYKITPIPISEKLEETVVASDAGILLPKIALVDVEGVILNAKESGLMCSGENMMALAVEKLQKAAADPQVKAVVVRVNTPGGGVTASDIIYREVVKIREGDKARKHPPKPVVAAMLDTAASGGYYIACGADEIMAQPTTVTGSIGVVMLTYSAKGLLDKVGVTTDAIKSGPRKDMGSPFKPMDPEDRKIFQDMINEFYTAFVHVVACSRTKLTEARIRQLADGRVYSGCQAQKLGLVDRIGGLDEALVRAKELAKIDSARVVMYHRPTGYRGSIYSAWEPLPVQKQQGNLINIQVPDVLQQQGMFMYLWQP
jgi:protease-4